MEPCPLCKSTDTEVVRGHDSATGNISILNYCKSCGCCAPPSAWNTRPADPQQAAIKALREALIKAQYYIDDRGTYCTVCERRTEEGHSSGCSTDAALKLLDGM